MTKSERHYLVRNISGPNIAEKYFEKVKDLNANIAPNYAFMLGQGQQANLMGSNALGGAVGGNAAKALQDYTQNFAANAYQNAFNNFQTQRGNIAAIDLANEIGRAHV